jgi:hypothetical protein
MDKQKKPGIPRFLNGSDGMDSVNHANQRPSIAFFTTLASQPSASSAPSAHPGKPLSERQWGFIQETLDQQMHVNGRTYIVE